VTVGPVLAVDIGTSSVRVAVVTPDAEVVDDVRAARPGDPGRSFDAEAMWSTVVASIAALTPAARSAVRVVSVAAHLGTVLLDERLRVTAPALGWSDRSGVGAVSEAFGDDRAELLRHTGRPVPAAGPLAALVGVRGTHGSAALALSPKDFVVARLTTQLAAEVTTDPTSAAYTGALDVASATWSAPVLDRLGVAPDALGRIVPATAVVGTVRDAAARATGLRPGTPVVSGGPDGTVGLTALLAGAAEGERAVGDVAGTTDVVAVRTADPAEAPPTAVVNPFPLGGWTIGGPTGTTGGAVAQWSRLLGFRDTAHAFEVLGDEVDAIPPGSDGLRIAVESSGSRFPRWDDAVRGGVAGLTDRHGRAHLLRAVVEGGARAVRDAVDVLPVPSDAPVLLAGGAARSLRIAAIRATVLGRPVHACDQPDVTLTGAALIGALADATTGERAALLERFARRGTVVDPQGARPARLGVA